MFGLANVYDCLTCGEVTDVYLYEHIDCDNDDVYPVMHCGKCNGEVREKRENGLPVYTEVEPNFFTEEGDDYVEDEDDFQ